MALVCDIKSVDTMEGKSKSQLPIDETPEDPQPEKEPEEHQQEQQQQNPSNEDLEDGEIEDDDEDVPSSEPVAPQPPSGPQNPVISSQPQSQSANNSDSDHRMENKFGEGKFGGGDGKFGENEFGKRPENKFGSPNNRFHDKYRDRRRFDRREVRRAGGAEDRGGKHLTEAEKSVMYLHKLERMEREKRERYKREQGTLIDDFASNIEKAIANVLKKEQKDKDGNVKTSDEEKEENKRGKKRKKKDKDKKRSKQRKLDSPKNEEIDEKEFLNIRGGNSEGKSFSSPKESKSPGGSRSSSQSDDVSDSESSDQSREEKGERKREQRLHYKRNPRGRNKDRRDRKHNREERNKEKKGEPHPKDGQNICVFYMQGKCNKGDECPYSHEVLPPMKLELCKFYLMDCCAKGDKCLYMHSEFPCKFYHTGLKCYAEDNCKFAHGKPLSEGLKQILFKHIETAPKEILGDFPRLTRDGAINMINQTQKSLEVKYGNERKDGGDKGIPSLFDINVSMPSELQSDGDKKDKTDKSGTRERKSRWQDADSSEGLATLQEQQLQMALRIKGFYRERDQDMRITSNGDVDMRTLPPHISTLPLQIPPLASQPPIMSFSKLPPNIPTTTTSTIVSEPISFSQDVDIRNTGDIDIRNTTSFFDTKDIDIRQPPPNFIRDVDSRQIDFAKDVDIRHLAHFPLETGIKSSTMTCDTDDRDNGDEPNLEIVMDEEKEQKGVAKADVDSRVLNFNGSAGLTIGMSLQQSANANKDIDNRVSSFGAMTSSLPPNLPKKQMELFLRIQAQQKDTLPDIRDSIPEDNDDANVDWYSDDDDDCKLTIKDDIEEPKPKVEEKPEIPALSFSQIKPNEVMEKLGDLSKIDISAEVTKLLSSISQGALSPKDPPKATILKDPRVAAQTSTTTSSSTTSVEPPKISPADPRRVRLSSTETKSKETRLSIYEQGSLSLENARKDVDLRNVGKDTDLRTTALGDLDLRGGTRPDIDLRHLNLPFKAIQNYTPATEIDASINSHPPVSWKVIQVDIPQPDYTGLKLSVQEAQNTGDPRLRKIFRLNSEEKDSPASPKESPKPAPARVDPRRRKMEETKPSDGTAQMTYAQQLNMLQSSAFYQSLTSNQKLLLNRELAAKSDGSGGHEPVLSGLLLNLGLLPSTSVSPAVSSTPNTGALNILANISSASMPPMNQNPNLLGPNPAMLNQTPNPMMQSPIGQNPSMMGPGPNQNIPGPIVQGSNFVNPNIIAQNPNVMGPAPGLLGGPGHPNIPNDFQLNFDPRQGGLLGNAPLDFPPHNMNFNNDEYYPEGGNFGGGGGGRGNNRNDRGFNRDRPQKRGRNFNNRSGGNRNFRNRNQNRSNRSRTPP